MNRLTDRKIILVTRATRLAELERRFSTRMQAKFYITHLGQDFSDYEMEDARYSASVRAVLQTLDGLGRVQQLDRSFLANFIFGPEDVVVVLGQDGLVANTVKYLNGQPVIGVNPDPARWDGRLLPFRLADLEVVTKEVLSGQRKLVLVTMAQARLNTGEVLFGVNDIFIGPRSHTSIRYDIEFANGREAHSSSGVIVSTGLGSSGWLKSLLAGATAIARAMNDRMRSRPESPERSPGSGDARVDDSGEFAWDASRLHFVVREPFPTRTTQTGLVTGEITTQHPLILTSRMAENGVIFSDGIESDFLEFNSGTRAVISVAEKQGRLVV